MIYMFLIVVTSLNLFSVASPASLRLSRKSSPSANQTAAYHPRASLAAPDYCNTPDGMALTEDDHIILSCPNFNDPSFPGILMRITPRDNLDFFYALPAHPETKRAAPMDLAFGPDGHLYVADNQYVYDRDNRSRLLRVRIQDGQPVATDVVVEGFKSANDVIWKDDAVFVSDTFWEVPGVERSSAVFRFTLEELRQGPVRLRHGDDPHIVAVFSTRNTPAGRTAGADGLAFDNSGRLYVGLFGDGRMFRLTLNDAGQIQTTELFMENRDIPCISGIFYDPHRDKIFIADSQRRAVHSVDMNGRVETLWVHDTPETYKGMDHQPFEPQIRNNKLYLSNLKISMPGAKSTGADTSRNITVMVLR